LIFFSIPLLYLSTSSLRWWVMKKIRLVFKTNVMVRNFLLLKSEENYFIEIGTLIHLLCAPWMLTIF
jgi:hypothetical protein